MIVFGRQVQDRSVAGKAGDDTSMFFDETGGLEGMPELLPLQSGIGYNPKLFVLGQRVDGGRQGSNGFFHALIGRSQFELGIETLQVAAEFIFKEQKRVAGVQFSTFPGQSGG
ncbi:MAG: hypothetical protein NDI90_03760 [Nitrospira sp. BO4]|nr:hypothetical protein [Nitrospira sp. BO4]